MKKLFFFLSAFCFFNANAQNYLISFAADGAAGTVEAITVKNLTANTSLELTGENTLRLTSTTNIPSELNRHQSEIQIYPNPLNEASVLEVSPPVSGDAVISIYDLTGKRIAQTSCYLENSVQQFSLSGVGIGFYTLTVEGRNYRYSTRLVGTGRDGSARIVKTASNVQKTDRKEITEMSKSDPSIIDMAYTAGDLLKFTGHSGNYATIVMVVPTADKTITFTFVECRDGDNNYYPVVKIGDQTWMAKNLATTKYASGTSLTIINSDAAWAALTWTDKAFCYYNNSTSNGTTYGALYTWLGAMDGAASSTSSPSGVQGVCPAGWHVPSRAEWTTLETTVGGGTMGGDKLKETGFTHWMFYAGYAGGTDESGYTALGNGYRLIADGTSDGLMLFGSFWTTTESALYQAYVRFLQADNGTITEFASGNKRNGYAVRCVKD